MPVSCGRFIKEARCTYVLTPYRNLANQSAPFGLDFLGFHGKTYIHADLPRIQCEKHGVKAVQAPWAREGSDFTLLFESCVIEVAKHLTVAVIARMVGEHDTRLWRCIHHYVDTARALEDFWMFPVNEILYMAAMKASKVLAQILVGKQERYTINAPCENRSIE